MPEVAILADDREQDAHRHAASAVMRGRYARFRIPRLTRATGLSQDAPRAAAKMSCLMVCRHKITFDDTLITLNQAKMAILREKKHFLFDISPTRL